MHRSIQELGIDRLSVADRITLAQDIWDSVADTVQRTSPSADEAAELDRRLAEDGNTPECAIDWQHIRSAVQNKWSQN
jgi:putative addiction module component (TIGR02574 family)